MLHLPATRAWLCPLYLPRVELVLCGGALALVSEEEGRVEQAVRVEPLPAVACGVS